MAVADEDYSRHDDGEGQKKGEAHPKYARDIFQTGVSVSNLQLRRLLGLDHFKKLTCRALAVALKQLDYGLWGVGRVVVVELGAVRTARGKVRLSWP